MKIAIAGKGGTGKTTIAATLARALGRRGASVWAVDADTNPNLARILGVDEDRVAQIAGLPREILEEDSGGDGPGVRLTIPPGELVSRYGARGPDGVGLLLMGRVDHAGSG